MSNNLTKPFDFLFIGMGASNCLLLLKMHENNLLQDKTIAIIEPNSKNVNDRNFCFWSSEEELFNLNLQDLICSKWQKIKVADRESQSISPLFYYHIKGIDLYNKVKEILKELEIHYFKELFTGKPIIKSKTFEINLTETNLNACKVFDSRPPSYEFAKKNQSHLLQSFYGWELSAKDYTFDTSTMIMMDFDIPQNNYYQFMYILPLTKNKALFEITRFGKEKITKDEADKLLLEYIDRFGFSYQILEEERGVIPMSSCKISNTNYGENWIFTGANANMIKPTTGYAFHNMAIDATKIVEAMLNQHTFTREKKPTRFKFYDNLLLKIIEETPQHGKRIFQNLFNQISIIKVLTFLSEKSSFRSELFIFSKLPILIFLRMAFKDIIYRFTSLSPAYLEFIITIFSVILFALSLDMIFWVFLGVGFLSVGLSHGALDHLTDKTTKGRKPFTRFVLSYLIKGSLLGLLWLILPDFALVVFISFSAWHFGQADFKEWNFKQGFNSFLWGLIVLITILFYHFDETIAILGLINGLQIDEISIGMSVNQLFIGKLSISFFSILFAAYNKSKLMLLTLCYLLLSSMLPLIVSFGIYFVMQHSLHGWRHLKKDLKLNSYNLWLKSLPFSLGGALIFLIIFLIHNKDYLGVFFIVLSCISMPHILSMNNFYKRDK